MKACSVVIAHKLDCQTASKIHSLSATNDGTESNASIDQSLALCLTVSKCAILEDCAHFGEGSRPGAETQSGDRRQDGLFAPESLISRPIEGFRFCCCGRPAGPSTGFLRNK
jgi:hypothetical protein